MMMYREKTGCKVLDYFDYKKYIGHLFSDTMKITKVLAVFEDPFKIQVRDGGGNDSMLGHVLLCTLHGLLEID